MNVRGAGSDLIPSSRELVELCKVAARFRMETFAPPRILKLRADATRTAIERSEREELQVMPYQEHLESNPAFPS